MALPFLAASRGLSSSSPLLWLLVLSALSPSFPVPPAGLAFSTASGVGFAFSTGSGVGFALPY